MHRLLAPPGEGSVHYVIMNQSKGMQKLKGRPGVYHLFGIGVATRPDISPVTKGGPKPLSTSQKDLRKLLQRFDKNLVNLSPANQFPGYDLLNARLDR